MVKLTLVSPKGNQGIRYFPYHGYLGLTPLKFEGLVRTRLERDGKPLPSKEITVSVRCYESRQGRLGNIYTNILADYSISLWKKPDHLEYADVGDSEHQFRLSIPTDAPSPSAANYFQEYRIFWRIEAVIHHTPLAGVGSRQARYFDLPLTRYKRPHQVSPSSPPTPISPFQLTSLSTKPRTPPIRYRVSVPTTPVGPLDIASISVYIQPPDATVHIRSATAIVERRIQFHDSNAASGLSTPVVPVPSSSSSSSSCQVSSYFQSRSAPSTSDSQSPYTNTTRTTYPDELDSANPSSTSLNYPTSASNFFSDNDTRPLLSHPSTTFSTFQCSSDRVVTHIFADVGSPGHFTRDANGMWKQTLSFAWPETRSSSRWVVGETLKTETASVRFFVRVKIVVSSSTSNAESIELEEQEMIVESTNTAQQQLALCKYNELLQASSNGRTKSKSPRRSKRPPDQLPSPPRSPMLHPPHTAPITLGHPSEPEPVGGHSYTMSTASSPYPNAKSKGRTARRPHTSAGPRDKPNGFNVRSYEPLPDENQAATLTRPETALPPTTCRNRSFSRGTFGQRWLIGPRQDSSSTSASSSIETSIIIREDIEHDGGSLSFGKVNEVDVLAWEEELARIESVSRRTSEDMMGMHKRTRLSRVGDLTSDVRTYLYTEG